MPKKENIVIGIFILTIFIGSAIVWYTFEDEGVRFRIDRDKTTLYLKDPVWTVHAREYNSLWDGTSKMNRDLSKTDTATEYNTEKNISITTRTTTYIRGAVIKDTYIFNGTKKQIEHYPEHHYIEIYNASGFIYQWEVRNIRNYEGDTIKNVKSPLLFGRIKLAWDEGSYWNTLYKSKIFKARWRVNSDYFMVENKVTDPTVTLSLDGGFADVHREIGGEVTISAATSAGDVCLRSNHPNIGYDDRCNTSSIIYNFPIIAGTNEFFISGKGTDKQLAFSTAGTFGLDINNMPNNTKVNPATTRIYGSTYSGTYPTNVRIGGYTGVYNDSEFESWTMGQLIGNITKRISFQDDSTTGRFTFNARPETKELNQPTYQVDTAKIIVVGLQGENQTTITTANAVEHHLKRAGFAYDTGNDRWYGFGGTRPATIPTSFCASPTNCNLADNYTSQGYFNPNNTRSWVNIGPGPNTIGWGASVLFQESTEYMWIIGGYNSNQNYGGFNYTTMYDVDEGSWTEKTEMPMPSGGGAYDPKGIYKPACVLDSTNNDIYCFGGSNNLGASDDNNLYYQYEEAWKYDIGTNAWSTLTSMAKRKGGAGAQMYNSTHIIIWGGWENISDYSETTYFYDIPADNYTTATATLNVAWPGTAKVGDEIYSIGGYSKETKVYKYNATGDSWDETDTVIPYSRYIQCDVEDDIIKCINPAETSFNSDCTVDYSNTWWDCDLTLNKTNLYSYPFNPSIQIGDAENASWSYSGTYKTTTTVDFSTELNSVLTECNTWANTNICNLTVYFSNEGGGIINWSSLEINTTLPELSLDLPIIDCGSDLLCTTDTIDVKTETAGRINFTDLNVTWNGYGIVNTTAYSGGDSSAARVIYIYYSDLNKTLPYTFANVTFFMPRSSNQSEVVAYGQTASTPAYNLTSKANVYPFDIDLRLNQSHDCLDIWVNTENNYSTATNLTTSYQEIKSDLAVRGNVGFWMWADLKTCNSSVNRYLAPDLEWNTCCSVCGEC